MKSTYSIRRPVTNLYLVRERDRRRRRELLRVLAFALPITAGVLVYVWMTHELLNTGYRTRELEMSLERLEQQERRLQVEASVLAGHERVERLAAEELGMEPIALEQTVFLEGDR